MLVQLFWKILTQISMKNVGSNFLFEKFYNIFKNIVYF
jgi:hypothetical protein